MAELRMGIAMSHGPMVVSEVPTWLKIAQLDQYSSLLVDTTGKPVSYEELEQAAGDRHAEVVYEERFDTQRKLVRTSLARLREEVREAGIDLLLVIGDDQRELFDDDYLPALAVDPRETLEFTTAGRRGRYGARVGGLDLRPRRLWDGRP